MLYNINLVKSIPDNLTNKDVKIHTNFHLVFPAGAGGNFLLNKIEGISVSATVTNEFLSRDTKWFNPESFVTDTEISMPEQIIAYATKINNSEISANYNMSTTHIPPVITAKLYDLSIKELFVVTIDDASSWLLLTMLFVKNYFVNDYSFKLVKIMTLINDLGNRNQLSWSDFQIMTHQLTETWENYGIQFGSPIQFMYLNWTKLTHRQVNVESFEQFLSAEIIKFYTLRMMGQDFKSHPDAIPMITPHCEIYNIIDYFDLFRYGKVPPGSIFDNRISREELKTYYLDNCFIIKRLAHLLPPLWQKQVARL
jgi:hypothetical protein